VVVAGATATVEGGAAATVAVVAGVAVAVAAAAVEPKGVDDPAPATPAEGTEVDVEVVGAVAPAGGGPTATLVDVPFAIKECRAIDGATMATTTPMVMVARLAVNRSLVLGMVVGSLAVG
jgi:hypothetical protein